MASHDQTKAVICGALAGIAVRSGWYSLGSAAHAIGQLDPIHNGAGFFGRIGLMITHSGTAIATGAIAVGAGLAIPYVVAKK